MMVDIRLFRVSGLHLDVKVMVWSWRVPRKMVRFILVSSCCSSTVFFCVMIQDDESEKRFMQNLRHLSDRNKTPCSC